MADLSRGARRCWRLLDWYRRHFDEVRPRLERLAKRLGYSGAPVTVRQVGRYMRELRAAGVIQVKRGGRGNANSYLVDKFVEINWKSAFDVRSNVRSNVRSSAAAAVSAGPTLAESCQEKCPVKAPGYLGVDVVTSGTVESQAAVENSGSAPRQTPKPFPEAEGNAIVRVIDRCGFETTPRLLQSLAAKAEYYGINGFAIAAHIERCIRRCERTKSNWPQQPSWITAVVENECAAASGMRAGEPKSPEQPLGDMGRPRKQSGGGSPVRVPLAAAGHGVPGEPAPAFGTAHETPCVPPELPLDRTETPRKAPVADPRWNRAIQGQISDLAKAKRVGGGR